MEGEGLVEIAAGAEAGEEVFEITGAESEPGVDGEEVEHVALDAEAEVEGLAGILLGAGEDRAGPGVDGGGRGAGGMEESVERFGAAEEEEGGEEGDAGEEDDADAPVGSRPNLEGGPEEEAEQEDKEAAAGAVGGEAGDDGGEGEEGEGGGDELFAADIGIDGAGEEDAADGEPVGHVVGVGKDPVGLGDSEGEWPAADLEDEDEDAHGGGEPAVGAEEEESFLGSSGLGAEPEEPSPAGEEEDEAFQGDRKLGEADAKGDREELLEGR